MATLITSVDQAKVSPATRFGQDEGDTCGAEFPAGALRAEAIRSTVALVRARGTGSAGRALIAVRLLGLSWWARRLVFSGFPSGLGKHASL